MKKIIAMAVIALSAVVVQAASIDWKVTGSAATENYQVYIVSAISADWTGVADIAADATALGNNTSGTIVKNGRTYALGPVRANGDSITVESASSLYLVIVSGDDAKSYNYVNFDLSASVYEPPATSPGAFSTTADALLAGASGSFASSGGDIPEPTSGILLLLGVAGLALRRKQK
ncbi:MAG: PEP-CTERM sorting domain-containing protein [Kiritimatiellia bacterium]